MLDVGWSELLVIGALALIVVGPRDLPQLLRTVGQWVGKIRRMAREFQRSLEDAARETDLANVKELRDLKKDMGSLDFRQQATKAQSYMNRPVAPEKTAAGPAAEPAAAAPADPAATPATAAPVEPEERRPQPAPGTGGSSLGAADGAEPRQAAKG